MADLSTLSDQELQALYGQAKAPAGPASDLSSLSDDQLVALHQKTTAPEQIQEFKALGPLNAPANALGGFTEQAGRAATFGLQDKVGALVPALNKIVGHVMTQGELPPWEDVSKAYHDELGKQRSAGDVYAENHPVASKVASTIGSVGSLAPSAATPILAGGKIAQPAATLAGRVAQGAGAGGAIGAASGFGNANDESVAQDLKSTGVGGAVGAITGGAIPVVSDYVVQPIVNWVARKFGSDAINNQAVQQIVERVKKDTSAGGPTAQDMLDLMNAVPNKPLALADVGGENVQALAGKVARAPGESRQIITQALNQRDVESGSRLASDVAQNVASGPSAFDAANALQQARAQAAKPLYEAAFAQSKPVDVQPVLNTIDQEMGQAKGGIRSSLDRARSYLMDQTGNPDTTIQGLHNSKLAIDDLINGASDSPIGRNAKRVLIGVQNELTSAMDQASTIGNKSLYAEARAAYSGPSQSLDAVTEGARLFNKSPSEIASEFSNLAPGDQEFYRLGAADALKQRIASTSSGGNEARAIVGNQYAQDRLRAIFPTQSAYDKFINAAQAENKMFQTRGSVLGGSQTAARVAEDQSSGMGAAAGDAFQTVLDAAHGNVPGALYAGSRTIGHMFSNPQGNPQVNAEIARLLTGTDSIAKRELLARIMALPPARPGATAATIPLASFAGRAFPQLPLLGGPTQ